MRMNLKNTSLKRKRNINLKFNNIKFNSKSLFVFLISFSIVTLILGIIFYYLISSQDKETVNNIVKNNFQIKNSYDYVKLLKESILENIYNIVIIWVLGLSIIGVIGGIFLYFCELFSIGFTISSIISTYKTKGILGILIYLVPSKILYVLVLFLLTYFSIKI